MSKQSEVITAVYADEDGNILDAPGMRGMPVKKASGIFPLAQ